MRKTRLEVATLVLFLPLAAAQAQCIRPLRLNAPSLSQEEQSRVLKKMADSKACSQADLMNVALAAIRELGFIKATPESGPAGDGSAISVIPGPQYRFGGFTIHGNHALNEGSLQRAYALQPGELASMSSIGKTLENIRKAYGQVGLQSTVATPVARFDEQQHLLTVDLQIDES